MDREIAQITGAVSQGLAALIPILLPVVFVGVGYLFLSIDRQRANSPSKDDTQVGLKLVLFTLLLAGVGVPAGGLQGFLAYALGGFKGGSGPIKMAIPPIVVGGGAVAAVADALLPRTNNGSSRQVERYALGSLGATFGVQMISELNHAARGARRFCESLREQGILAKETHESVIRLAPPLVIPTEEIDWALQRVRKVLA